MSGHEYARHRDRGRDTAKKRYADCGPVVVVNSDVDKNYHALGSKSSLMFEELEITGRILPVTEN